jgi:hypothetical protein
MEAEWTPQMIETLGIDNASLPIIRDADFLYGPRTASGASGSTQRPIRDLDSGCRAPAAPISGLFLQ